MKRPLLAGLTLVLPLASFPLLGSSAPAAGPGAVLAMHQQLFAALDRGDVETVRRSLGETPMGADWTPAAGWASPRGFLAWNSECGGPGFRADSREDALRALLAWGAQGTKGDGGWTTKITSAWSDCHSPEISFAALEFERTRTVDGKSETARYRSTSLVSHDGERWILWLFHVSRV
jgi:hypothetical protein